MRAWMSAQRPGASGAASAPGPSASRMASARAEPFAYASATCDCQRAASADRRPDARASQTIRPMMIRAATASKTHNHGLVDPLVVEVLVGEGSADVVSAAGDGDGEGDGDGDGGAVVTSGVGWAAHSSAQPTASGGW